MAYFEKRCFRGVYVDIGADDAIDGNVTKLFYDQGWRGINIDPIQGKMESYTEIRKRDVNLVLGISNKEGVLEYMGADAFSSFYPEKIQGIKEYCKKHNLPCRMAESRVKRLTDVLDEYMQGEDIHILKIDVENYETEVFERMDFEKYKPWAICIEAIEQFTANRFCHGNIF